MRTAVIGFLILSAAGLSPAAPRAKDPPKPVKLGIQTPGVQVPMAKLKPEAELSVMGLPESVLAEQSIWISNRPKNTLERIDPKTNKLAEAVPGLKEPCANPQVASSGTGLAYGFAPT